MLKITKTKGFTLVELSVSTLLLVTVVAGLLAAFVSANRLVQGKNNTAYYVARSRLDQLFEAVRNDWWSAAGKPLSVGGPTPDGTITLDGIVYTRSYTVASVDRNGDTVEDYRSAEVTVSWTP